MKIFEFNKYFSNEATCRRKFKEMRGKEGVTCKHCRHRTDFEHRAYRKTA